MNLIGRLPGYPGEVWYNPDGIANIISLADAEKYFPVRYDSAREKAFVVEKPDGTECQFIKMENGLYCLDLVATTQAKEHAMAIVTKKQNPILNCPIGCLETDNIYTGMSISGFYVLGHSIPL
jgi:hypothetical protein